MGKIKKFLNKTVCLLLSATIFFCVSSIFFGCEENNIYDGQLLRLHIRANSDSAADQAVKLKVRDAVNEYITNSIHKTTFDEAYAEIERALPVLSRIAAETLEKHGFFYGAKAKLVNELFPARMYADVTVPEGYYDALVIELGSARGANWWCVVYPPLCYGEHFRYKSFFAELFG